MSGAAVRKHAGCVNGMLVFKAVSCACTFAAKAAPCTMPHLPTRISPTSCTVAKRCLGRSCPVMQLMLAEVASKLANTLAAGEQDFSGLLAGSGAVDMSQTKADVANTRQ